MSKKKAGQYADGSPTVPGGPIGDTSVPAGGNGEGGAAKPTETKREKFIRLARRRVPKAEKALAQVSNLFRPGMYDCEERHLNEVERLLQRALDKCRDNFVAVKPKAAPPNLFVEDTFPQHNGE